MRTQDAMDSLMSTECPACHRKKGSFKSVCYSCWKKLSPEIANDLYQRIGEGYEKAIDRAIEALKT